METNLHRFERRAPRALAIVHARRPLARAGWIAAGMLAAALAALAAAGARAAQAPPAAGPAGPAPVPAARLGAPVSVDGLLKEGAWQGAPSFSRLTQQLPFEGAAPSESTDVWIAFDDAALYVAARCWDARPESIAAPLARRDTPVAADRATVLLDPFDDHRTGYEFCVTAGGEMLDATLYNDGIEDLSWDGVWEGRSQRDERGWTLEMRIPFSQLRCAPGPKPVWGVNFVRHLVRRAEKDWLVFTPRAGSGFENRFPHLAGLETGRRRRPLEITPYLTGKAEALARAPGDPFARGTRFTPQPGGDLRMGLGSSLTLNATVNPDFGQVEVDPAVVNLSDVESFFQEKRPFFTENAGAFRFGREGANTWISGNWPEPTFFYSRRIGRAPQGGVPAGSQYSEVPVATHIQGAAKLTGRPVPGVSLGVLGALTSREEARWAGGGLEGSAQIEPATAYGVARALGTFRGGYEGLGLVSTLVDRRLDDPALGAQLARRSLVAGLDGWHFVDRRKVWVVTGWGAVSRLEGTPASLVRVQRSSRHYLQRPDAERLGVDSAATVLSGLAGRIALNKQEGNVLFNAALGAIEPRFDVNEVGFQSRSDVITGHVSPGYHFTRANAWRREALVRGLVYAARDLDGDVTGAGFYGSGTVTFVNDWTLGAEAMFCPDIMNAIRSRGGPLMREPHGTYAALDLSTAEKTRLVYGLHVDRTYTPAANGTDYWTLAPSVRWKPAERLDLQVGPTLQRVIEDAQYVRRIAAPGEVPDDFGGMRYVFARMEQTTIAADLRLSVSFTRNLTLQVYAQPLVSAARFGDFKELARAGSYDFVHYGRDPGTSYADGVAVPAGGTPFALGDPSFDVRSVRGNAVLRWEPRAGSVLYLIWTQERSDDEPGRTLSLERSARRLFEARADNVFLAKATVHVGL